MPVSLAQCWLPPRRRPPRKRPPWPANCIRLAPAVKVAAARDSPRRTWRSFLQRLLALGADGRRRHYEQEQERSDQEGEADWLGDEHREIAARDQQRAAEVLLHHRTEDKTEDEG